MGAMDWLKGTFKSKPPMEHWSIAKAQFLFISQVMLPCHSHAAVVRFFQNATAATQLDQATGRHTMIHPIVNPLLNHVEP
jgi:hypothetical protein